MTLTYDRDTLAVTRSAERPSLEEIALAMLPRYGWSESEFGCLVDLWTRESNWDPYAENPTSSAYGIP